MKVIVLVHPNSKHPRIEEREGVLHVYVSAAPIGGKANKAVRDVLSTHFKSPKSSIVLVSGGAYKLKIFEVS